MAATKRATIYLDVRIHRALRRKAEETDQSVSDLVNAAMRRSLSEDAEDLAAFDERSTEPTLSFGTVVKSLKRRGKL